MEIFSASYFFILFANNNYTLTNEFLFSKLVDKLVHLTISEELIITTVDHPFYVRNYGFINAGEFQVGDEVVNSNGDILVVRDIKIEHVENPVTVYNFQVEDWHTYHVGKLGILVHNAEYTGHGLDQAVYAKKNGGYYDVVITNSEGKVITCVGGNTKSLPNWNAVTKMLNNNGGYSSLPID